MENNERKKINILYYIMMAVFVIIVLSATLLGQGKRILKKFFLLAKFPFISTKKTYQKTVLQRPIIFMRMIF